MTIMDRLLDFVLKPSAGKVQLTSAYVGQPTDSPPRWARPGIARTAFEFLPHYDPERVELLQACLARPDEPDLRGCETKVDVGRPFPSFERARRRSALVCAGDPDRYRRWLGARLRAMREREIAAFGVADVAAGA